jgi:MFS family permease
MREYVTLLQKNANYRNLWFGTLISQMGDWFNLIAAAGLIARLTGSGVAVSGLFLARFLPLFLFSPLAGVLADRYDRRRIMIMADLLRAMTVASFLLVRAADQVWLFYLLTVLLFTLSALFTPARSAVLANVVEKGDLVKANALDSLTWSTMLALGAFIGGVVAGLFGADVAFIADAGTFLLSAWFISRIAIAPRTKAAGRRAGGWFEFLDGLKYLRHERFILGVSLAKAGGALVWGAINVLEVTFAEEVFTLNLGRTGEALRLTDVGAATLGAIYFVTGVGTGLGPIFMRRWLGDRPPRLMLGISIGFVLMTIGIFGLGVSPTFEWYLLMTLVRTVGTGALWVFSAALLQMVVPDAVRGRVFAFEFAMLTLTQSISIFVAGYMLDNLGLEVRQVTVSMAAGGVLISIVWLLFYLVNRARVRAGRSLIHGDSSISI